jgi:dGTPase
MMDWSRLLSDARCPRQGDGVKRVEPDRFRSAFEADYDRIVFSTPFRRLARKTQVHPLALNDHIHNRLTHSLEVASIGRSLGRRLARFLRERGELPREEEFELDVLWVMQASCLAHDIGNPPFGHAGEYAIREWVKQHREVIFDKGGVTDAGLRADMEIFEGNAQGFRMGIRADNSKSGYLRLTYATLGAMIKYPWDSTDERAAKLGKFNVFSTEKAMFARMAEELGLAQGGRVARHPLSFLLEAADDICYRIIDMEDASVMGILDEDEVREVFAEIAGVKPGDMPVQVLRGDAIKFLIDRFWDVFEKEYEPIMRGEREGDLKVGLDARTAGQMEKIRRIYPDIFAHRNKVAIEVGAYRTLGRIIEVLCDSTLELSKTKRFKGSGYLTQKCLQFAWGEAYAARYEGMGYEWWLHQVMDFVSSLTDNYARQLAREIEGG